jgi:hypothetical protein
MGTEAMSSILITFFGALIALLFAIIGWLVNQGFKETKERNSAEFLSLRQQISDGFTLSRRTDRRVDRLENDFGRLTGQLEGKGCIDTGAFPVHRYTPDSASPLDNIQYDHCAHKAVKHG